MHVVVIDNSKASMAKIIHLLESMYLIADVKGFTDSKEACDFLKSHQVDVVITEMLLDEQNGLQLVEKLKGENPRLHIALMSHTDAYALDAYQAHADGYLLKPMDEDKLWELVEYASGKVSYS